MPATERATTPKEGACPQEGGLHGVAPTTWGGPYHAHDDERAMALVLWSYLHRGENVLYFAKAVSDT